MDHLPLSRDPHSEELIMAGMGQVALRIDYQDILGRGGQGLVFRGQVTDLRGSLVKEVALKINGSDQHDSQHYLEEEANMHAQAWLHLDNIVEPLGFLEAHDPTGTPAMLVMEIGLPLGTYLEQVPPAPNRNAAFTKALTRVTFQLLRFIVSGDSINLMHRDIKMQNMYVRNADDLTRVELVVGDFGGAQRGEQTVNSALVDVEAIYRAGVYSWDHTSPRMASIVYNGMAEHGGRYEEIEIDRQACLYNDLFGWARIAVVALMSRPAPDVLCGPSSEDYAQIPDMGCGDVSDATHNLLHFALDLLTVGRIDTLVDRAYIHSFGWYGRLPMILG